MLQEYALEPTLINSWDRFQRFVTQFGVSQGRLISEFPKHWKRLVFEGLTNCKPKEKLKIVERLHRLDERFIQRPDAVFAKEADKSWLENAELEHDRKPFHAVIAESNPRRLSFVLEYEELDETAPPPLWRTEVPRDFHQFRLIGSQGQNMAAYEYLGRVVRHVFHRILIVDPHLLSGPDQVLATESMLRMLRPGTDPAVRIHTYRLQSIDRGSFGSDDEQQAEVQRLKRELPHLGLQVYLEHRFLSEHDRLIFFESTIDGDVKYHKALLGQGLYGFLPQCRKNSNGILFEISGADFEAAWKNSMG
ncbi:MAG: hypothetical protein Aurels2KO_55410 [Aureliella sp.]